MAPSNRNMQELTKKFDREDTDSSCRALHEMGFREGKRTLHHLQTLRQREPLNSRIEDVVRLALDSPNPDLAVSNFERVTSCLADGVLNSFYSEG